MGRFGNFRLTFGWFEFVWVGLVMVRLGWFGLTLGLAILGILLGKPQKDSFRAKKLKFHFLRSKQKEKCNATHVTQLE